MKAKGKLTIVGLSNASSYWIGNYMRKYGCASTCLSNVTAKQTENKTNYSGMKVAFAWFWKITDKTWNLPCSDWKIVSFILKSKNTSGIIQKYRLFKVFTLNWQAVSFLITINTYRRISDRRTCNVELIYDVDRSHLLLNSFLPGCFLTEQGKWCHLSGTQSWTIVYCRLKLGQKF